MLRCPVSFSALHFFAVAKVFLLVVKLTSRYDSDHFIIEQMVQNGHGVEFSELF